MMPATTLKVKLQDSVQRVPLREGQVNYESIAETIQTIHPDGAVATYLNEEGDQCALCDQSTFQDMMNLSSATGDAGKVLRLQLRPVGQQPEAAAAASVGVGDPDAASSELLEWEEQEDWEEGDEFGDGANAWRCQEPGCVYMATWHKSHCCVACMHTCGMGHGPSCDRVTLKDAEGAGSDDGRSTEEEEAAGRGGGPAPGGAKSQASVGTFVVPCGTLKFTQFPILGCFSDGEPLSSLTDAVVKDPAYPLKEDGLVLNVFEEGGRMWCTDNRRLYCFQAAQARLGNGKRVWVQIRMTSARVRTWCQNVCDGSRRGSDASPAQEGVATKEPKVLSLTAAAEDEDDDSSYVLLPEVCRPVRGGESEARGVACASPGCNFKVTWFSEYCCYSCKLGGRHHHGPHCDRVLMPRAQQAAGQTGEEGPDGGAHGPSLGLSFQVELGAGRFAAIEWKLGDDPLQVAERFAAQHDVDSLELPVVRRFVEEHSADRARQVQ